MIGILLLVGVSVVAAWASVRARPFLLAAAIVTTVLLPNLALVLPSLYPVRSIGGFDVRAWDPILLAVLTVVAASALALSQRFLDMFRHPAIALWAALAVWVALSVARGVPSEGLGNSLGETRTYYGALLLVPYFALIRNKRELLRIHVWVQGAILLLFPIGLLRAVFDPDLPHGFQWLNSPAALALAFASLTAVVVSHHNVRPRDVWMRLLLAGSVVVVVITAHRSVWMAAAAGIVVLLSLLDIRGKIRYLASAFALLLVAATAVVVVIQDPGEFFASRVIAYSDPVQDETGNWRLTLWRQSMEQFTENPIAGKGLGSHFRFVAPSGELVTTAPHNAYITIALQLGLIGLSLYLAMVVTLAKAFLRGRRSLSPLVRAYASAGILVLVVTHVYYLAYSQWDDWLSWTFIGLCFAFVAHRELAWSRHLEAESSVGSLN